MSYQRATRAKLPSSAFHCRKSASVGIPALSTIGFPKAREGSRTISGWSPRSEEHTSELQSLMRISYAVFCLKKKNNNTNRQEQFKNLQIYATPTEVQRYKNNHYMCHTY